MNTSEPMSNERFGIYHDLSIKAPDAKVFQAVSEPGHLVNWWPQRCTGKPETGQEYNFFFTEEYNWYGKVSKCVPNTSFHIKMTHADADWNPTTFGFDLETEKEHVVVHFTHINWPKRNAHFKTASFCWAMLLKGLKDYLEKGIILPFEERS